MPTSVTPFLMFEGAAEEAMQFYVSIFDGAQVLDLERFPSGSSSEGQVYKGLIRIAGQVIRFFDSPAHHDFGFTPAVSLFVECRSEEELTGLAAALGEGGRFLMPLDNYGFSRLFAWVNDRFGVSWQLNLA
jgi:predicted 3-demethylubiquinone-9 3-methyltransferase (glyoxalase superfamily)